MVVVLIWGELDNPDFLEDEVVDVVVFVVVVELELSVHMTRSFLAAAALLVVTPGLDFPTGIVIVDGGVGVDREVLVMEKERSEDIEEAGDISVCNGESNVNIRAHMVMTHYWRKTHLWRLCRCVRTLLGARDGDREGLRLWGWC